MTSEVIDTTAVVVSDQPSITLFQTDDPEEVVTKATKIAKTLANVIRTQKLANNIQGKEYVRVEGWTLLGSMLGVFPVEDWTRPLPDGNGWEARVEARRGDTVIGAAEAMCTRDEPRWAKGKADEYALRSMAQTRATAKALRLPLGFVMHLAGYQVTPSEEMDGVRDHGGLERSGRMITEKQAGYLARLMRQMYDMAGEEAVGFFKALAASYPHAADDKGRFLSKQLSAGEAGEVIDLVLKAIREAQENVPATKEAVDFDADLPNE